jgi:hypothetical protein
VQQIGLYVTLAERQFFTPPVAPALRAAGRSGSQRWELLCKSFAGDQAAAGLPQVPSSAPAWLAFAFARCLLFRHGHQFQAGDICEG